MPTSLPRSYRPTLASECRSSAERHARQTDRTHSLLSKRNAAIQVRRNGLDLIVEDTNGNVFTFGRSEAEPARLERLAVTWAVKGDAHCDEGAMEARAARIAKAFLDRQVGGRR